MLLVQPGAWPATITPRAPELADPLAHRWCATLDAVGPRLAPIADSVYLVDSSGRVRLLGASEPDFAEPPTHQLPLGAFRPAQESDPVYVTDAGDVARWSPVGGLRGGWFSGLPGPALDALGLDGDRTLVSSPRWADGLRLLDELSERLLWSIERRASLMLAAGSLALALRGATLSAADLASGSVAWERKDVDVLAAIAGDTVWIIDGVATLCGLAIATGEVTASLELGWRAPRTLLAPTGLLHIAGGAFGLMVVDLIAGGTVASAHEYPLEDQRLLTATPHLVTADGRLLLAADGALLEVRAPAAQLTEVWSAEGMITEAHVGGGCLFVLEERFGEPAALHCLGTG
jgi:hypothetical protein